MWDIFSRMSGFVSVGRIKQVIWLTPCQEDFTKERSPQGGKCIIISVEMKTEMQWGSDVAHTSYEIIGVYKMVLQDVEDCYPFL